MAITLKEIFHVKAPVEAVWRFLLDPEQVVTCMPGAALDEVVDGETFLGNIKVKVGPIVASYKGRVRFTNVDHEQHVIEMTAEGTEASGGSANGTMSSRVQPSPDGGAEVIAEASAEVTGRVMQFGRGMIQGVSEHIFRQFAARVSERLESMEAGAERDEPPPAVEQKPINAPSLVFSTIWAAVVRLFRRVLRRSSAERP
jgi:carbon monoxide dehydrogenase subunit G